MAGVQGLRSQPIKYVDSSNNLRAYRRRDSVRPVRQSTGRGADSPKIHWAERQELTNVGVESRKNYARTCGVISTLTLAKASMTARGFR